jgi:hypothetical protein
LRPCSFKTTAYDLDRKVERIKMKVTATITPVILASVAFCLALPATPRVLATRAQQYEEAAPPSYPKEDNFFLGRYGMASGRQTVFKLSDGDEILLERQVRAWAARPTGQPSPWFVLELRTSRRVKWWKAITVYKNELPTPEHPKGRWLRLGHVSVTDNMTSVESYLNVSMSQLRGGLVLVFEKAKAFGAHTPVHGMLLTEANDDLAGQRLIFTWDKD